MFAHWPRYCDSAGRQTPARIFITLSVFHLEPVKLAIWQSVKWTDSDRKKSCISVATIAETGEPEERNQPRHNGLGVCRCRGSGTLVA